LSPALAKREWVVWEFEIATNPLLPRLVEDKVNFIN
jgi:hypothetical protein